jgi:flagellar basal-body rod modification protein FlgD
VFQEKQEPTTVPGKAGKSGLNFMASISAVNATSGLAPSAASQSSNPSQTLNQGDFLKLLVTQMTSQDPLSPESDTDMAAQMAQFSSLQASQNTETDIEGLQANALLGQTVSVVSTGSPQMGVVSSVQLQAGSEPQIIVNGQPYTLSQLQSIYPNVVAPAATTPTTTPSTTSNSSKTPANSNAN